MNLPTIRSDIQRVIVVLGIAITLLTTLISDASDGSAHLIVHWVSIAVTVLTGVVAFLKTEEAALPQSSEGRQ